MTWWRPFALSLPLALGVADAAPASKPPPLSPSLHQRQHAVQRWAGDAPLLVVADVELAEAQPTQEAPGARSVVVLRIVEILRDDLDSELREGDRLWMEIPGGALDDQLVFSSNAPLLFEGDQVLARLDLDDEGPVFTSIDDVLPVEDDAVRVCVNPSFEGVDRCDGMGAAALYDDQTSAFPAPDLSTETALPDLADALR